MWCFCLSLDLVPSGRSSCYTCVSSSLAFMYIWPHPRPPLLFFRCFICCCLFVFLLPTRCLLAENNNHGVEQSRLLRFRVLLRSLATGIMMDRNLVNNSNLLSCPGNPLTVQYGMHRWWCVSNWHWSWRIRGIGAAYSPVTDGFMSCVSHSVTWNSASSFSNTFYSSIHPSTTTSSCLGHCAFEEPTD